MTDFAERRYEYSYNKILQSYERFNHYPLRRWWFGAGLPSSALGWSIWAVSLLLFAGIARSLYLGHNLTRWAVAVVVAVAAVLMPIYKPELPGGVHLPVYLLQFVLPVLATLLTFTPSARAWFARPVVG